MENLEDIPNTAKEVQSRQNDKNITQELQARKCGNRSFTNLKQCFLGNRINEMSMSHYIDFEQVYKSSLNSLDVERSGRYLLSSGRDGSVFIHDLFNFSGNKVYQCKVVEGITVTDDAVPPLLGMYPQTPMSVETVQWYPFDSGMFLTSGMDRKVRVWDSNLMKPVQTFHFAAKIFQHHMSPVLTGSSPLIAVASGLSEVKMVDLRTGLYCQELRGHSNCVFSCRWSPTDPYLLATGSYDCTIRLWDARSSKACFAILDKENRRQQDNRRNNLRSHMGAVNGLEFTPNGRLLLSLGSDNAMHCWDLHSWKNLNIPYGKINNRKGRAIEFATCGFRNRHYCFVPDQFSIVIFELETGNKVRSLCGHFSQVNTCYFHRDRMELYSGGQDRNILIWTVESQADDDEKRVRQFSCLLGLDSSWDSDMEEPDLGE